MKKLIALVLCLVMVLSLAACGGGGDTNEPGTGTNDPSTGTNDPSTGTNDPTSPGTTDDPNEPAYTVTEFDPNATYTYSTYTSSLSGNWNPHDYEDAGSSDIMTYLQDAFYGFAFNDELHPLDDPTRTPFDGYVIIPYMASGDPIDVTEEVKALHPDWIPEEATSGYAYAIPMRDDLYFDTGYHITAETFVQSMKYLLDPELLNYRATDIYAGSTGIVGAQAYATQGHAVVLDNGDEGHALSDFVKNDDGVYTLDGDPVYISLGDKLSWLGGSYSLSFYVNAYGTDYFGVDHWDELLALADDDGRVPCTDENLALLSTVTTSNPAWGETDDDLPNYLVILTTMPSGIDYDSTVGFYAKDEYTLVQVFKSSIGGFDLYYGGIQDSLVLVEPDVYESCLTVDPATGVKTSTYMTSAETSPSYGPYSMTLYQTGKMVHYQKNPNYYGWHDDVNNVYKDPEDGNVYRLYQTTDIDLQVVSESATAKNMFLAGQLISYGLQTEDYAEYGLSDYLYASPSASVMFLLFSGNLQGLQAQEAAADFDQTKYDVETITLKSFMKAMAVGLDRQSFCDAIAPASIPAFGLFGIGQIYDADTAGIYRYTDAAREALCEFYGIDVSAYSSLADAEDAITGYDVVQARELLNTCFQEALAAGYITDNDNDGICDQTLRLKYAIAEVAEGYTKRVNWLNQACAELTKGTPFDGKIEFTESAPLGDTGWAPAIKNGEAEFCFGGWSGSAMDPYNLLTAYTWDNYAYAATWYDTRSDMLTINVDGKNITLSVYDWADALNGTLVKDADGNSYSFSGNDVDVETRVGILAKVEEQILKSYNYVPFSNSGSKLLLSQKVYYVVEEYNPVMGRGGIAYLKYNYNDADWEAYCTAQIAEHGQLQY